MGVSPSKFQADDPQLWRQPWAALEVKSKNSTIRSIFLWLIASEEAFIRLDKDGRSPK
jgi:hypothetical protein